MHCEVGRKVAPLYPLHFNGSFKTDRHALKPSVLQTMRLLNHALERISVRLIKGKISLNSLCLQTFKKTYYFTSGFSLLALLLISLLARLKNDLVLRNQDIKVINERLLDLMVCKAYSFKIGSILA